MGNKAQGRPKIFKYATAALTSGQTAWLLHGEAKRGRESKWGMEQPSSERGGDLVLGDVQQKRGDLVLGGDVQSDPG